jgi:hypothetical protein
MMQAGDSPLALQLVRENQARGYMAPLRIMPGKSAC